jgi:hypothetical protein
MTDTPSRQPAADPHPVELSATDNPLPLYQTQIQKKNHLIAVKHSIFSSTCLDGMPEH